MLQLTIICKVHLIRFLPTYGWQANESVLSEWCRLSVRPSVCDDRGLWPNGDRPSHDFSASWQGLHLATPGNKQHRNRSSRFRAVADLTNIGSSFKTVRDRYMVTMKHDCEVGIWPSESVYKFYIGWPWVGHPSNRWASCYRNRPIRACPLSVHSVHLINVMDTNIFAYRQV